MKLLPCAVLTCLVTATPALANPVYLTCTLTDNGGESVFDVQLNETNGTVSYFIHRNGMTVQKRAVFTPDRVTFNGFAIDRRTLEFSRDNTGSAFYSAGDPPTDVGQCAIDDRERAF